jgi:signal peptidase I
MGDFKKAKKISLSDIFFLLGFLFILFYVFLRLQILSIFVFTFFILSIYFDIKEGVRKSGIFGYLKDFLISILIIVCFWIASMIILQTPSPYNAVASCSMLPELQRGDAVVLTKVNITKIAPVVNVDPSFVQDLFLEFNKQEVCAACNGTICSINQVPKNSRFVVYSYKEKKIVEPALNISCGECTKIYLNGSSEKIPCFKFVTIGNKKIYPEKNNSIIVYETSSEDSMQGPIIHRAVVVLNASNNYFVLTKGDNNPDLDFQYGVSPKNLSSIIGEVIFKIPILGYAKLFLFGQFSEPPGCNFIIKS